MSYASMTCNAHVTSDPVEFAEWLVATIKEHELQLVALQELTHAHRQALLRRLPKGWKMSKAGPLEGSESVAVLVGPKVPALASRVVRMGRKGWFGWRSGKQHAPRFLAFTHIIGVGVFGSTHAPPGVDVTPRGLLGKADRAAAWLSFVRAFRRWGRARKKFVVAADWNEPHGKVGRFGIGWLARKVGANPRGAGIDYALIKGVNVKRLKRIPGGPGSDHDCLLFEIGD